MLDDKKKTGTDLVNAEDILMWWNCIFRHADMVASPEDFIEVRKVGVLNGSVFNESIPIQPWLFDDGDTGADKAAFSSIRSRVVFAAEVGVGAFMSPSILSDRSATDESVKYLLAVTLDLDSGNTFEKLSQLEKAGLKPTLIVGSGGVTEENTPKLHIHFRLSEPCGEPWKVAHVREVLAKRFGGDSSFKRIPQVVRIPGSVHDKNPDDPKPVQIMHADPDHEYDLSDFCDLLDIDFNNIPAEYFWSDEKQGVSGTGDFIGKDPEAQKDRLKQITGTVISAGGDENDSRWQRFTEYAGRMVMHARLGEISLEEAYQTVYSWTQTNMSPPWPDARIAQEFGALVKLDKNKNPEAWAALEPKSVEVVQPEKTKETWTLKDFRITDRYKTDPPPVPWLVEELLIENTIHALVADGGVGKTYLALDMAMRLAAGEGEEFLGFKVKKKAVCIVLTVEDSDDDIHRRIQNMDRDGSLRRKAEDRVYVVPVLDEIKGGLTLVEKDRLGNHKPSEVWTWFVGKVKDIMSEHAGMPVLVVIDTYSATHHGDENSSIGTNEWFRAAALLRAECKAAILVTHHIRKTDTEKEIKTVADFRGLVRGSIAFLNNCRAVFGVWEMPSQEALKKEAMLEDEARLFNFGLVKSNTAIDWSHRGNPKFPEPLITLRRKGDGSLIYDGLVHSARINGSDRAKERRAGAEKQLKAALLKAVEVYAKAGYPLSIKDLTREYETYLPKEVHKVPNARKLIEGFLNELRAEGAIVRLEVGGGGRGRPAVVHDLPDGDYAVKAANERSSTAPVIQWSNFRYDTETKSYRNTL